MKERGGCTEDSRDKIRKGKETEFAEVLFTPTNAPVVRTAWTADVLNKVARKAWLLLGHERERRREHLVGNVLLGKDLGGADLDAHLVILGTSQPAGVLLVLVRRASAVVEDSDDGCPSTLVHGHVEAGGAGAERGRCR